MQIHKGTLKSDRPWCHVCKTTDCVHAHGSYSRSKDSEGDGKVNVPRYKCKRHNRTWSILPEGMLPYSWLCMQMLQSWLDWVFDVVNKQPTLRENEKESARRAHKAFCRHTPSLMQLLGQIIDQPRTTPKQLWLQLKKHFGSLQKIQIFLAEQFHTSCLGSYHIIKPWSVTK